MKMALVVGILYDTKVEPEDLDDLESTEDAEIVVLYNAPFNSLVQSIWDLLDEAEAFSLLASKQLQERVKQLEDNIL